MTKREQIVESMNAMDDAMASIASSRDIWQNDIIYHICKAIKLLLLDKLREVPR